NVPADYVRITSGLGEATPINLVVLPVLFEGQVKAVIELSSFERFSATHQAFLDQLVESIGIVLNTIEANTLTEDLLKQSQTLATELQSRQQELQQTNAELEEKAALLAEQNSEVERKNSEVEQARQALEEKARQLALTSKYKSEFLANMSHELRTPLNSLLILADQLASNTDGNLTSRQVEFSKTIYGSGKDLLRLINDILDLSKIESGTVSVDISACPFQELLDGLERTFRPVADRKDLELSIHVDPALPLMFETDPQRLDQVLKNLLSNAFKFTERGGVTVRVGYATRGWSEEHHGLNRAPTVLAFAVTDTGIGIAGEKQQSIFEAFQQADGSTSRKYGGTGLGLAISREIARLLGGEIRLTSVPEKGSTFTLYLPQSFIPPQRFPSASPYEPRLAGKPEGAATAEPVMPVRQTLSSMLADDRDNIQPGDQVVLIVEDDAHFAEFERELVREKGFKALVASHGSQALALAREYHPEGILLDISLADLNGWHVLERLKDDLTTRHIPVFVVSADEEPENALRHGALAFIRKPVSQDALIAVLDQIGMFRNQPRRLLVIEDDATQRETMAKLLGHEGLEMRAAVSASEAVTALAEERFDTVIVDLVLPDASGFDLVRDIRLLHPHLPILVYTAKDLSNEEEIQLNRAAQIIILKDVRSPERLFDQTMLWLHRRVDTLDSEQRAMLAKLHSKDAVLANRKVLIVDDDVRNIFAMTSVLERYKMTVLPAETGRQAIDALESDRDIEVVLMDIMLPEMDGYETMREIRSTHDFKKLPIIALTAKAMKGDREKCIDAGASDYISKPVDTEKLISLLRMWLHR
ncbi:MAG TPA: response regulator, partial [Chthoniobacteraceae bacterium]|nr:response regulator [Chthoniobacteraceae bacterium]